MRLLVVTLRSAGKHTRRELRYSNVVSQKTFPRRGDKEIAWRTRRTGQIARIPNRKNEAR
jgi:hypothetical protein